MTAQPFISHIWSQGAYTFLRHFELPNRPLRLSRRSLLDYRAAWADAPLSAAYRQVIRHAGVDGECRRWNTGTSPVTPPLQNLGTAVGFAPMTGLSGVPYSSSVR